MAKKPKAGEAIPAAASGPRPRLVKLTIKNFGAVQWASIDLLKQAVEKKLATNNRFPGDVAHD